MARLVLDTNSLIQCISRRNKYHDIWLSILDGRNELCVTTEILAEYEEILIKMTSSRFASLALNVILNNPYTLFVTTYYHFNLIETDSNDNKFVDCAVAANAKYIVTQDHHYDILLLIDFPKVEILSLNEMLDLLTRNKV